MSNIKLAKAAIQAELNTAIEGVTFYQARVASLELALNGLDIVDGNSAATPQRRGRKPSAGAVEAVESKKAKAPVTVKRGKKAKGKGEPLPPTGKEFWLGLAGSEPKSSAEIYDAAVQALGISPSEEQAKKLAQRQANALSVMCKSGELSSTGSGRERRYFK